jgi:hypothetical protein
MLWWSQSAGRAGSENGVLPLAEPRASRFLDMAWELRIAR